MSKPLIGELSVKSKIFLFFFPIVCALAALCFGRMNLSASDVVNALFARFNGDITVSPHTYATVWSLRLPRILLALVVGLGLSLSGLAFQSLFANPLATPDTLGVASGASFGAALGILLGFKLLAIQFCAFLFGLIAVFLTYIAADGQKRGTVSMILGGIMIGSLFSALVSLVKYTADTDSQLPEITYWLMGSLQQAGFPSLKIGAPVILIGALILYFLRWRLNILPLSDDEARSSGINIKALRLITIICAAMMTGACIAMCGQVGWVGLLIPHICRMRFGNNHLSLVPACASLGAGFMVIVDTLARSLWASEIPISILTAIIGAPFFIILMRRTGGWQL